MDQTAFPARFHLDWPRHETKEQKIMTADPNLSVVTGATGLLGSHIVEQLLARGERVRALVRPTSDVTFLRRLGIELANGDLADRESIRRAVAGASVVYHCAAKVGEWGPWRVYQEQVIDATRNVLEACRSEKVGRVLYVSSITVYGHLRERAGGFTEEEPLGQNLWTWDHYCRSKILAENIARQFGPAVTTIRPSWTYGPRDRNSLPRLLLALRAGRVRVIGSGDNPLNIIYASDVAEGAILAARHPAAAGEAYNLSSAGEITQRQFIDALTDELGMPRITRHMPYGLAFWTGFVSELIGHAIRIRRPPHITRYAVALVARPTGFSTAKARTQLGWQPRVKPLEGLQRTLAWLRSQDKSGKLSLAAGISKAF